MFGQRFFAKSYFAGRYFPPIGDAILVEDGSGDFPYPVLRRRGRR